MKRPKKEDFKVKYNKRDAELCSATKQYSRAQDEYIDYLEQLNIHNDVGRSEQSSCTCRKPIRINWNREYCLNCGGLIP